MIKRLMNLAKESYAKCKSIGDMIGTTIGLLLGLAIGFGLLGLIAWLLSAIYHEIAWNFNLPEFSFGWWFCVVLVLNWAYRILRHRNDKEAV